MEHIDEEVGDLVDLEDVPKFKHINDSTEHIDEANEDNPNQIANPEEPPLPNLLFDWMDMAYYKIWTILIVKIWRNI